MAEERLYPEDEADFRGQLARLLRWARERQGLPQRDLADRIGVRQPDIAHYERAYAMPSAYRLVLLVRELKLTADDLIALLEETAEPCHPEHASEGSG